MKKFFQKRSIFRKKSIDKCFRLWYNSVNKYRAGAPKRKGEKMKFYVNNLDNNKVVEVEVAEEYRALIDNIEDEGEKYFETLAKQFAKVVKAKVKNAFEAYENEEDARNFFNPFFAL